VSWLYPQGACGNVHQEAEMAQEIDADDEELHVCQQENPGEAAAIEDEVRLAFAPAWNGLAVWTS
jgi:hypothetical protein